MMPQPMHAPPVSGVRADPYTAPRPWHDATPRVAAMARRNVGEVKRAIFYRNGDSIHNIYDVETRQIVQDVGDVSDGAAYVCTTSPADKLRVDIDYRAIKAKKWRRPPARRRATNPHLPGDNKKKAPATDASHRKAFSSPSKFPSPGKARVVTVYNNSDTRGTLGHKIVLNRRTTRSMHQVMVMLSQTIPATGGVQKLYHLGGRRVVDVQELLKGDTVFIAAGHERLNKDLLSFLRSMNPEHQDTRTPSHNRHDGVGSNETHSGAAAANTEPSSSPRLPAIKLYNGAQMASPAARSAFNSSFSPLPPILSPLPSEEAANSPRKPAASPQSDLSSVNRLVEEATAPELRQQTEKLRQMQGYKQRLKMRESRRVQNEEQILSQHIDDHLNFESKLNEERIRQKSILETKMARRQISSSMMANARRQATGPLAEEPGASQQHRRLSKSTSPAPQRRKYTTLHETAATMIQTTFRRYRSRKNRSPAPKPTPVVKKKAPGQTPAPKPVAAAPPRPTPQKSPKPPAATKSPEMAAPDALAVPEDNKEEPVGQSALMSPRPPRRKQPASKPAKIAAEQQPQQETSNPAKGAEPAERMLSSPESAELPSTSRAMQPPSPTKPSAVAAEPTAASPRPGSAEADDRGAVKSPSPPLGPTSPETDKEKPATKAAKMRQESGAVRSTPTPPKSPPPQRKAVNARRPRPQPVPAVDVESAPVSPAADNKPANNKPDEKPDEMQSNKASKAVSPPAPMSPASSTSPTSPNMSGPDGRRRSKLSPYGVVDKVFVDERYAIGPALGDGNFAVVKSCIHRETKKRYAMKIIDKSKTKGAKETRMIENEVKIMQSLDHPNCIKLYDVFDTPSHLYMAMELVEGGDLFDRIVARGKYTEQDAARLVRNMATAMDYLHSRNIIHRDLKPENLLVTQDQNGNDVIKLGDFGLSMVITRPLRTICGTPTYVAPEIISDTAEGYGLPVDMWAMGVITYIILCGFPPFASPTKSQKDLFNRIRRGRFSFPDPYWKDVSETAKDLISKLLVVDQKKRYTAQQVLNHPWISQPPKPESEATLLHVSEELLRHFPAKSRWRRIANKFSAVTAFQNGGSSNSGSPVPKDK